MTSKTAFFPLIAAQFLSAFADNAVLFAVIAIVLHGHSLPAWYVPALQSAFLVAFVVLAPWVGRFADNRSKPRVLLLANCIKAAGAGLILAGMEPLVAYAIVGAGAAFYAPAKYGILPEMVEHSGLVKANSWIEGATILAILLGAMGGAAVADRSVELALAGVVGVYLLSAGITLALPRLPASHRLEGRPVSPLSLFVAMTAGFLASPRARLAVLGSSLFWSAAACLRVILVAWAPLVLFLPNASDVAALTLFLAIGIIAGSTAAPFLIPLERLRRVRLAAHAMALLIALLALLDQLWPARGALMLIGVAGGVFVVPINAALQEAGHQSVGSGNAVAVQGFMENLAMLLAVGAYTFASARGLAPAGALLCLAGAVFVATFALSLRAAGPAAKSARK